MSQYAFQPAVPHRETNGLGVAGFVVSLAGLLLTGGLLSPVGVVISLIALGRRPRGFAVALVRESVAIDRAGLLDANEVHAAHLLHLSFHFEHGQHAANRCYWQAGAPSDVVNM